jgi:4'-phosphopantetheinyl transferase EntD
MIEKIVPSFVATKEAEADSKEVLPLQEERFILGAIEGRRREFAAGRTCARHALERLGIQPVAIPAGDDRAPIWPNGIVGSITHCPGYRAAAVAHHRHVSAIGIDAEPNIRLPNAVLRRIMLPAECGLLEEVGFQNDVAWDRLAFSAKESTFKAAYGLVRHRFDFRDYELRIRPVEREFTIRFHNDNKESLPEIAGRWLVESGYLITTVVVLPSVSPLNVTVRHPLP